MLNILIVEEKGENITVLAKLKARRLISDPVTIVQPLEIREKVIEKLREKYKKEEITFLSEIERMKNTNENSNVAQEFKILLKKKVKKVKKKKLDHKVKPGESSGSSKS